MAKKEGMIVIKKITIAGGGGHGGSWKVALADFMTAMMAFFLVMWLLNQTDETKKAVSDYFSTPSVIEYSFQNYGVELTLEKLFLDLTNEPLKAFQEFMEPSDKTPNLLDMGSKRVVMAHMADQLGDLAQQVRVYEDGLEFVISDTILFDPGTAKANQDFLITMEKVKTITTGLEDADVLIVSQLFNQSVGDSNPQLAKNVAEERLDIIVNKIESALEHPTVGVSGETKIENKEDFKEGQPRPFGFIQIRIKQREFKSDGSKQRKLEGVSDDSNPDLNAYENFVNEISKRKK